MGTTCVSLHGFVHSTANLKALGKFKLLGEDIVVRKLTLQDFFFLQNQAIACTVFVHKLRARTHDVRDTRAGRPSRLVTTCGVRDTRGVRPSRLAVQAPRP